MAVAKNRLTDGNKLDVHCGIDGAGTDQYGLMLSAAMSCPGSPPLPAGGVEDEQAAIRRPARKKEVRVGAHFQANGPLDDAH